MDQLIKTEEPVTWSIRGVYKETRDILDAAADAKGVAMGHYFNETIKVIVQESIHKNKAAPDIASLLQRIEETIRVLLDRGPQATGSSDSTVPVISNSKFFDQFDLVHAHIGDLQSLLSSQDSKNLLTRIFVLLEDLNRKVAETSISNISAVRDDLSFIDRLLSDIQKSIGALPGPDALKLDSRFEALNFRLEALGNLVENRKIATDPKLSAEVAELKTLILEMNNKKPVSFFARLIGK